MVTGLLLIAAGVGIELFASVSRSIGNAQAQAGRQRGVSRFGQRVLDFNAETGPQLNVWLGRGVRATAIVTGIVLAIQAQ